MKKWIPVVLVMIPWFVPVFIGGMWAGQRQSNAHDYEMGRWQGRGEILEIWLKADDPNYDSQSDPNHIDYYDPNDPWVFNPPENPVIYINEDTFRLHPGSSIKYVEIGDPCVVVSYIEPKATGDGIYFDVNDPNLYGGTLIIHCSFNMVDPNCDDSNWYCNRCKLPPSLFEGYVSWTDSVVIENCAFEVNDPSVRIKW